MHKGENHDKSKSDKSKSGNQFIENNGKRKYRSEIKNGSS